MKSEVIFGYFFVALLLISMFFINAGFSSPLEHKNGLISTISARYIVARPQVGGNVEHYSLLPDETLVVSISPTSATINFGESQLFTSAVSGGTSPFTYQWYLNDAPVSGATSAMWTFVPSSAGAYNVYLNVTDNLGVTAKSNTALLIVRLGFSATILPSSLTMGIGQSQLFTSTVSGGTPPYAYQWYMNDTPTSGATSSTWTFTSTSSGSYMVSLGVIDAASKNATSNTVPVTVINYPTNVSVNPAQKTVLIGQTFTIDIYVSNVTNLFAYEFRLTYNAGVVNLTGPPKAAIPQAGTFLVPSDGASYFVTPWTLNETSSYSPPYQTAHCGYTLLAPELGRNGSGILVTFTFKALAAGSTLLDVNGDTLADPLANPIPHNRFDSFVTVNSLLSVSILPVSVTMDIGQSQLFTSAVSGGTSPFTYQWYLNSAPISGATSATWTFIPTLAGAYNVYLNVTDNVGVRAKSNVASVVVHWSPSVVISPTAVVMDVSQSQLFSSTVSNGTSPYTYQWYSNNVAVSGATSPSWTFIASSSGSYNIYVNVTDSVGFRAKSNVASITVNPLPSVTVSPTSFVMDVGQSQLFTSAVSDGTSPYTYQWYSNGTAISGATSSSYTFTPASRGHYSIHARITDSVGIAVTSNNSTVTVNIVQLVAILPTSVTIDIGQSQLFVSTVSDGTSPFTYQWYLNDAPVSGATSATWTFVPVSIGSYNVYVNVTDNVNVTVKSNIAPVTVNPPPIVSILPVSVVIDADQSQPFTSEISGGASPFGYQWYLNGVALSGATSATWTFTPSLAGLYEVYLNITDNVNFTTKSNVVTVTVNPPIAVTISPTSVNMEVNQSQLFTAVVTNGTPPYTYQWYLDDIPVPDATSPTWSLVPTTDGTYRVYLKVTDLVNSTVQSDAANVTVGGIHDISVTEILNSKSRCAPLPTIGQNLTLQINVTISNLGDFNESFGVVVYANATEIQRITTVDLAPGSAITLTFNWNTTDFPKGNYVIGAFAQPVADETDTANNSIVGETVVIVTPGDINADGVVDIIDIVLIANRFGWTYPHLNWNPNADLNDDGIMDIIDVVLVAAHFGEMG